MQFVGEAVLSKIRSQPLLYATTHNKIVYLTKNELIVKSLQIQNKEDILKIKGNDIFKLVVDDSKYVVLLYRSGLLEVRRMDKIDQVVKSVDGIACKIQSNHPKIKLNSDNLYLLQERSLSIISLKSNEQPQFIELAESLKQKTKDIIVSNLLQSQKIIILQFQSVITFSFESVPITLLQISKITQMRLLSHPLQLSGKTREYLAVVSMNRWLKIYNMLNLLQIYELELYVDANQEVELKSDPLNQYLLVRIWNPSKGTTISNTLYKINQELYSLNGNFYAITEPFFLFDIQIGLKENVFLFPTHLQMIKGKECKSIDMCFFKNKEIRIGTFLHQSHYQSKILHSKMSDPHWKQSIEWKEIILNLIDANELLDTEDGAELDSLIKFNLDHGSQKKQKLSNQNTDEPKSLEKRIYPQKDAFDKVSQEEWEKFIAKFLTDNYYNVKGESGEEDKTPKCLDISHKKIEPDDGLMNTLSGSSSHKSLCNDSSNHSVEERLLKLIEAQSEDNKSKKELKDVIEDEGSESDGEQIFFDEVSKIVVNEFDKIEAQFSQFQEKIGRFEDIHVYKLKKIQRMAINHSKQCKNIKKIIENQCERSMKVITSNIKQSLKRFNANIGKLQILQTRSLKKMKKNYRDYINEELETLLERLQASEASTEKIRYLMNEFETSIK